MTETQHTSGQWAVEPEEAVFGVQPRVYSDGKLICEVGNAEEYIDAFKEWTANAHLIASAPHLLTSLKEAAFWLEGALQCKSWIWDQDQREAADLSLAAAVKAISEAEGH